MTTDRARPQLHLTPAHGWMNDPHGIVFDGSNWHVFYQYVPDSTTWRSDLEWGHQVSSDLVAWRELPAAVRPVPGELGCWSGSVVFDTDGTPMMFMTVPRSDDWGMGQVVALRGSTDCMTWERVDGNPLIDGPAPGHGFYDFRDPNVRRDGDRWKLVIGAGIRDQGGAALQYSSPDLLHWTFDGVLAHRAATATDPVVTGTVWECPQFIEVDGRWVLIISAMDHEPGSAQMLVVRYAIGDYDGLTFTAETWGTFCHTPFGYATTTFRDREGRPCSMTWVKEIGNTAPAGSPWASAQSLVSVLSIVDGRLVVTPHPQFEAYLPTRVEFNADNAELTEQVSGPWRLTVQPVAGLQIDVDAAAPWSMTVDGAQLRATTAAGTDLFTSPLPAGAHRLDIVVDADVCEVYWPGGEGWTVARVPANTEMAVRVSGTTVSGALRQN